MAKRRKEGSDRGTGERRVPETRSLFLLDELGRFVCGASAAGAPLEERLVPRELLEGARALVAGREVPPGTFQARSSGDLSVVVVGGAEFFGCAGEDSVVKRAVPLELAAVVNAFESVAAADITAGGLRHSTIQGFPAMVAAVLGDPGRYAKEPTQPLTFARAAFRPSGTRLALDLEVVNATPWTASVVQIQLAHDGRALPLVSVKAKSGGFGGGVLELPPIAPRTRDRAVLLFEPREPGIHVVGGDLTLRFEDGQVRTAPIRPARTLISLPNVSAMVPDTLRDFRRLIEGGLKFSARLDLPETLGGIATVSGIGTEIEKDQLAKVLDWHPPVGGRELWYLGTGMANERPLLVQVTEGAEHRAEVVIAASTMVDVLGYAALLRSRLTHDYNVGRPQPYVRRIDADLAPEATQAVLHPALVAKQLSKEIDTSELESKMRRPKSRAVSGAGPVIGQGKSRSAGDELVPGLIDAVERALGSRRVGDGTR